MKKFICLFKWILNPEGLNNTNLINVKFNNKKGIAEFAKIKYYLFWYRIKMKCFSVQQIIYYTILYCNIIKSFIVAFQLLNLIKKLKKKFAQFFFQNFLFLK